jgi:negative regulator of flagellin synthesis FlgM
VDPISTRGVTGSDALVAAATRVSAAPAPTPIVRQDEPTRVAVQAGGIARELAATAPVDLERVARLKKAIDSGSFRILPATIADRLLALKSDGNSHGSEQEPQA